jgi:hypothetical protein
LIMRQSRGHQPKERETIKDQLITID